MDIYWRRREGDAVLYQIKPKKSKIFPKPTNPFFGDNYKIIDMSFACYMEVMGQSNTNTLRVLN